MYKERLQTKYLKDPRNKRPLDSSCWPFLHTGLHDFRGGGPSSAGEIPPGAKTGVSPGVSPAVSSGVSPVIFHDAPDRTCKRAPRKRFSKQHACFSKQMVQKQIRREHVAAVEGKLLQHPLSQYPHYQESVTPELFDKVMSVLDPDMCVNSISAAPTPAAEQTEEEEEERYTETNVEEVNRAEQGTAANETNPEIQKSSPEKPHIGLEIEENAAEEKRLSSDEDVEKVTALFSDCFTSLGEGTSSSSIESASLGHFVSAFEETLTVPIQVGNVDNLPDERCSAVTPSSRQDTDVLRDSESNKRTPGTKKPRYLRPKTHVVDPSDVSSELEFQLHTSEKDEELKQMYVTEAFRQYIIHKGLRMPRFLDNLFSEEERGSQEKGASGSAAARRGIGQSGSSFSREAKK